MSRLTIEGVRRVGNRNYSATAREHAETVFRSPTACPRARRAAGAGAVPRLRLADDGRGDVGVPVRAVRAETWVGGG